MDTVLSSPTIVYLQAQAVLFETVEKISGHWTERNFERSKDQAYSFSDFLQRYAKGLYSELFIASCIEYTSFVIFLFFANGSIGSAGDKLNQTDEEGEARISKGY